MSYAYKTGVAIRLFIGKLVEGFLLGFGLYLFYQFAMWMEWIQ